MGRVVVSEFLTVDGVMEDPGGSEGTERGGWAFRFDRGDEGNKVKLDEVTSADALLLGRTTYEGFAAAWPGRTDDVGFAEKMNTMPKYVVSTTLTDPSWENTTVIPGDVASAVDDLRHQLDGDVLVNGSARLVQTLIDQELVDVLRLMVFPLVLGTGKRLFGGTRAATSLRLTECQPVGADGVVVLTYQPADGG